MDQMMTDREMALRKLAVGDIFHGESSNGASLICLVTSVTEATIHARRVTTQDDLVFDRKAGMVLRDDSTHGDGTIDSIAPLPGEIHAVLLGLDQKFRFEQDPERLKLSQAEKQAFHFVDGFYRENQV